MTTRPVRLTIRKRGVKDAQDRPLYSIVAGGTGLDLKPGEKMVGWFIENLEPGGRADESAADRAIREARDIHESRGGGE